MGRQIGTKIAYVDLLRPLWEMVGRTVIYPPDDDGHPTAAGYGVIARAVEKAMGAEPAGVRPSPSANHAGSGT